jgi:CheY-like chemotaxis protein
MLEDDEASSQVLMDALRAESLRVVRVQDAASGLARAHEIQPAAILVDVLMHGAAAWDAVRQFKGSPATADIPILLAGVLDGRTLGFPLGASVWVSKPLERAELLTALAHIQRMPIDRPVLVVDDDPADCDMLSSFFSSEGIPLAQCASVQAALDWLRDPRNLPGMVLLDLTMPQAGGFAVLQALRSAPRLSAVPVVILCAEHLGEGEQVDLHTHIAQAISQQVWPAGALLKGLLAALG